MKAPRFSSNGDAPSKLALFRVRFVAGTADVAEAQASLHGRDIGRRNKLKRQRG